MHSLASKLLEMLKAHKKGIRRAAVNTFGYIAKAIGPQDVLHTLLNNLKVQERQNRVCTTVAIAIVAETSSPFTVLPALMKVPRARAERAERRAQGARLHVRVHRRDGEGLCLRHHAAARGRADGPRPGAPPDRMHDRQAPRARRRRPNIFETSPHVISAVFEAVEGAIVALGPCQVLHYVLQGLYHPARRVRDVYWKVYNTLYIYGADALTCACLPAARGRRRQQLHAHLHGGLHFF